MHESEKRKWSRSVVSRLLATPWTAAYQAPLSMGFSRQEYWSGVPLPSLSLEMEHTYKASLQSPTSPFILRPPLSLFWQVCFQFMFWYFKAYISNCEVFLCVFNIYINKHKFTILTLPSILLLLLLIIVFWRSVIFPYILLYIYIYIHTTFIYLFFYFGLLFANFRTL